MATSVKNGKKKRPVFSKRYFPVQLAVFEFRHDDRVSHSVEVTKTFRRDEESDWETTSYLSTQDLLPAAKLLEEAYGFIQARLQKEFEDTREEESVDASEAKPVPF